MGRKFYFIVSMGIILYYIFSFYSYKSISFVVLHHIFQKKLFILLSNLTRGLDISNLLKWSLSRLLISGHICRQTASARVDTNISTSRATASSLIVRMLVWLWSSYPLSQSSSSTNQTLLFHPSPHHLVVLPLPLAPCATLCPHPSAHLVAPIRVMAPTASMTSPNCPTTGVVPGKPGAHGREARHHRVRVVVGLGMANDRVWVG
jgi:hypothetical protein